MAGNVRYRLAKLEKQLSDLTRLKELANCICKQNTVALEADEFEAEMNLPCPCHGFRRLGVIDQIVFVNPDLTKEPNPRLDELLATYESRLEEADRTTADAI